MDHQHFAPPEYNHHHHQLKLEQKKQHCQQPIVILETDGHMSESITENPFCCRKQITKNQFLSQDRPIIQKNTLISKSIFLMASLAYAQNFVFLTNGKPNEKEMNNRGSKIKN